MSLYLPWRDILPGTLLVALGMGACVAPLTTSVIEAVDQEHVGMASGFNSAVARIAALIGAASALAAAGCALALIARE